MARTDSKALAGPYVSRCGRRGDFAVMAISMPIGSPSSRKRSRIPAASIARRIARLFAIGTRCAFSKSPHRAERVARAFASSVCDQRSAIRSD
jgi:hypothetical protein